MALDLIQVLVPVKGVEVQILSSALFAGKDLRRFAVSPFFVFEANGDTVEITLGLSRCFFPLPKRRITLWLLSNHAMDFIASFSVLAVRTFLARHVRLAEFIA